MNAEEMLAQALAGDNESSSEDNQTLVVNWDRRTIDIPSNMKCLGVESDDDVTQVEFLMPKTYCDIDLSEFLIYINYLNAKGEGDVYKVKDATVVDDTITFTWLVGRNALTYKGVVKFNICLKKMDAEDPTVVDRELNTTITSLPVLEGLETSEAVIQKYADILVEWEQELFGKFDTLASNLDEKIVGKVGEYIKENPEDVDNAVTEYLSENPPPPGPIGPVGPQGNTGESAYDAAVRLGLTTLSEEEWVREYDVKRTQAIQDIDNKHTEAVNDINTKHTEAVNDINTKHTEAVNDINAKHTEAVNDINEAGEGYVEAINAAVENAVIRTEELEAASATQVTKVNNAGAAQVTAVNTAGATQITAIENKGKNTLADIPETYTDLDSKVKYLNDFKADAIVDTSAKAASHELYAQDGPMSVTLHGATYQAGTGDPSPDNVRPISGVDAATVMAGGWNALCLGTLRSPSHNSYCAIQEDGTILLNKTNSSDPLISIYLKHPVTVGNGMKFVVEKNTISLINVNVYTKESGMVQDRKIIDDGLYSYNLSAYEGQTIDRVGVYLHPAAQYENATVRYMLRYDDKTEYEPFNASVIDMTHVLNGKQLYDGDTIQNNCLLDYDGEFIFDGSDDENWRVSDSSPGSFFIDWEYAYIKNIGPVALNMETRGFANLVSVKGDTVFGYYNGGSYVRPYEMNRYYMRISGLTAVEELRAYLSANPVKVYYQTPSYVAGTKKVLTVFKQTKDRKVFDSSDGWTPDVQQGSNRFFAPLSGADRCDTSRLKAYCNWLPLLASGGTVNANATGFTIVNENIYIRVSGITTLEELDTKLKETPLECVYPLIKSRNAYSEPIELRKPVNLMPVTVTGSGETTVEYQFDTKTYIDANHDSLAGTVEELSGDHEELVGTIENINSEVSKLKETIYKDMYVELYNWQRDASDEAPCGWAQGYYRTQDAIVRPADYAYMRTARKISLNGVKEIKVTPPSGYAVAVHMFKEDGSFDVYGHGNTLNNPQNINVPRTIDASGYKFVAISVGTFSPAYPEAYKDEALIKTIGMEMTYEESKIDRNVPTEYFEQEAIETVSSVRNVLTEPCLVFPMITDIHYMSDPDNPQLFDTSIENMKRIAADVALDFVLNLGDLTDGMAAQDITLGRTDYMLNRFHEIGLPYYCAVGNHDTNHYVQTFSLAQMYRGYIAGTKDAVFNGVMCGTDCYKDFDNLGVRLIVLNGSCNKNYSYSADTVSWLSNVALNTDYIVILATHFSSISSQNWNNTSPGNGGQIQAAVQSFVDGGGTVIQLCGHSHADYHFVSPWLTIFSTCSKFESTDTTAAGYTMITGYEGDLVSPVREMGTATEESWSVVVVRPNARKINLIRFGAGKDREFTF